MAEAPPFPRSPLPSAASAASAPETGADGPAPPGPRPAWQRLTTWLPAAAVAACAGVVLGFYGVSVTDLVLFSGYVTLGLALPGLLWVRLLYRRPRALPEEVALGLTFGYALEVLASLLSRAAGVPLLVAVWPLGTYALFLAVPRLHRHWKGAPRPAPTSLRWSWGLALGVICLIGWTAADRFGAPLAPAGVLDGHEWSIQAHLAAAALTGIEPLVLSSRLAMLPILGTLVVLLGAVGRRVIGTWAGALGALAATVFVAAPSLYRGAAGVFAWEPVQSWSSPARTFGALLFASVVLVVVDLLGDRRQTRGRWVFLVVMLVAVMGAKAAYLPLLAGGLVAVVAVETVRWFSLPRRAVAALGLTGVCLAVAPAAGMSPAAGPVVRETLGRLTGLGDEAPSPAALLGVALLLTLCGAITWCGAFGLVSRPQLLLRPPVVLVLGMSATGLLLGLLLGDRHFLEGPYPYLAMVAVYGLLLVVRRARLPLRSVLLAAGTGVLAAYLVRVLCDVEVPLGRGEEVVLLYLPYLALMGVVLLVALALLAARTGGRRTFALVICLVTAAGTPAAWFAGVTPGMAPSPLVEVREVPVSAIP
ncbi:hypothetical protein [Nonomuraea cavernae]|uniref:Uncharacterized protein n=1 Tax=Nonomuraea cavernae TaxID=2045107 RepID=A0A917YST6_9ACTN|nr:hypothetical protein [Nonomuraea cavernae]MCA2185139.1 hypothetical protein [Nonomuraea cavernae]GGO65531.1 hypothetical protein GCM10012289_17440 [Nonomuraea cavernae]